MKSSLQDDGAAELSDRLRKTRVLFAPRGPWATLPSWAWALLRGAEYAPGFISWCNTRRPGALCPENCKQPRGEVRKRRISLSYPLL